MRLIAIIMFMILVAAGTSYLVFWFEKENGEDDD
jgi:flagellar basal body-associated protein FliL